MAQTLSARVRIAFVALSALLASACAIQTHAAQCILPNARVLAQEGAPNAVNSTSLRVWTLPTSPLWSTTSVPPALVAWRRALVDAKTTPAFLLAQSPTPNNLIVASHASWIGPAQCVETALLAEQYARIPLDQQSTEFAAFLLRSPDGMQLRIYDYTRNADGIGRVSPLTDAMAPDLASGWRLAALLHNHNFHAGQPALNGIIAPSGPDARLAQSLAENYGLEAMWITNGVDTVRIPRSAFSLLATHD